MTAGRAESLCQARTNASAQGQERPIRSHRRRAWFARRAGRWQIRELPGVAVRLAVLPDRRARRGRLHSLAPVLSTAACAVPAGARSCAAIGQWARHAPQDTLARLGFHPRGTLGVRRAASPPTVRRMLAGVCPGGLADLLGRALAARNRSRWTAGAPAVRAPTPPRPPTSCPRSRPPAAPSAGRECRTGPARSPASPPCSHRSPPTGTVVAADVLHTRREHAKWPAEAENAHHLMIAKATSPTSTQRPRSCPGKRPRHAATTARPDTAAARPARSAPSPASTWTSPTPSRR
ncbi:transposase family protein [Streptomyces erythrochromogenes]|uniref:transposase family protein n=1 Tax=Streptomyces erythrochromogenes TaxID=285574 RepID=UPI0036A4C9B9